MILKRLLLAVLILHSSLALCQSTKLDFKKALATSNTAMQKELALNLVNEYSNFTYTYYSLLLKSLPKKAIIITNALDDTFPITILQLKNNYRTDVEVISLGMLKDSAYLQFINNKHGLNLTSISKDQNAKVISNKLSAVFISTTVKSSVWYNSNYYLIGLIAQANNNNQLKHLREFYSEYQKFKVLTVHFKESDKVLVQNILPSLITLYKLDSSDTTLRSDILKLAGIVGKADKVKEILGNN